MTNADRARATFVRLMQTARTRQLTAHEKSELSRARQALRRARRPVMNARRSSPKTRVHYLVELSGRYFTGSGWNARRPAARRYGERSEANEVARFYGAHVVMVDPVHEARQAAIDRGSFVWVNRSRLGRMEAAGLPSYVFSHRGLVTDVKGDRIELRFAGVPISAPNKFWFDREVLDLQNPSRRLRLTKTAAARIKRNISRDLGRRRLTRNPRRVRMGRLVELRYERDHGKKPGYYKHEFKSKPVVYYEPGSDRIIVEGGR